MDSLFKAMDGVIVIFVTESLAIILAFTLFFALVFWVRYKAKGKLHKQGALLGAFIGANAGLAFVAFRVVFTALKAMI